MKRAYDTEMIRDFLEHLQWELRIRHFESTRKIGTQHPELTEQLEKCICKHSTKGLLYTNRIDKTGLAEEKAKEVIEIIREGMAAEAQEALQALDVLEPILEEALDCASRPDDLLARTINLVEFLQAMKQQEGQDRNETQQ